MHGDLGANGGLVEFLGLQPPSPTTGATLVFRCGMHQHCILLALFISKIYIYNARLFIPYPFYPMIFNVNLKRSQSCLE